MSGLDRSAELAAAPKGPGVYLFWCDTQQLPASADFAEPAGSGREAPTKRQALYVGKAGSLRARIAQHFSNPSTSAGEHLLDEATELEYILTETEAEALLLEQSLISELSPRYNIALRDDKSYPYIAVSLDEPYPRVYLTREKRKRGRRYFGPYAKAGPATETLELLSKVFRFRTCEGKAPGRSSGSPCLEYFIERCTAPCADYVGAEAYGEQIQGVIDFLSGKSAAVTSGIEQQMQAASLSQDYEEAARLRNRLQAIQTLLERQSITAGTESFEVVACAVDSERPARANAQILKVVGGQVRERASFAIENPEELARERVAEAFIAGHYRGAALCPKKIVIQPGVDPDGVLAEALSRAQGRSIALHKPARGRARSLLELAVKNADSALDQESQRKQAKERQGLLACEDLAAALSSEEIFERIECFDISNLGETHTVASMAVFSLGQPRKSDYRRFEIHKASQDDYKAMKEVLSRRVGQWRAQQARSEHEAGYDPSFAARPDLIVIDGGKGQLSAALAVLGPLIKEGTRVISLAKREEEVFRPGHSEPLVLARDRPALLLLQRIRNEAHRFAISFHRSRREQAMTRSLLDDLPGVGKKRKLILIAHFKTPERVLAASEEELVAVPGLPEKLARQIHAHLHRPAS